MMRAPQALAVLAAALLAACGSRGGLYTHPLAPLDAAAGGHLVRIDAASGRAVLVAPDGSTRVARLVSSIRDVTPTPDGAALAVLGVGDTESVFQLFDPKTGSVKSAPPVAGQFDRVAVAPAGGHAVLYCTASSTASGSVMRNLNAFAVVDLATMKPTRFTLDTDSLAPTKVVFAPRPTAGSRQLVAVLFARGLVLLDAAAPEQAPRRIAVTPQSSSTEIEVVDARFTPDLKFAMLRASGLDDLVAVELGESDGRVTASLNFLSGGTGLCALDLPGPTPAPAAVALYCTSHQLVVLDARGQEDGTRRLQLPEKLTGLHVFPDGKILAFDATGGSRSLVAWDPASGKSGTAVLETRFDRALFSDARGQAVLLGRLGTANSIVVVGVEEQTSKLRLKTTAIQLNGAARAQVFDPSGGQLFVSVDSSLARLDLDSLESMSLQLSAAPEALLFLDGADALAALMPKARDQSSDFFLVDAKKFDAASTLRVEGTLFAGDLDRAAGGN